MGQNESLFKRTYAQTVSELSSVQLGQIASRFNDLYAKAGGPKGHLVDREAFSTHFKLPVTVGDRLFDAFDEQQNGKISFEEFVCGLAILLHGSFSDKCQLLFKVFNIHGDEGVSREELTTMLTAIVLSTNTILYTTCMGEGGSAVMYGENKQQAVKRMVDTAFKNCDISRSGKLLPLEFEYWLKCNPKVLDTLLSFKTKEEVCTLGHLIIEEGQPLDAATLPLTTAVQQPPFDNTLETKPVSKPVMEPNSPTLLVMVTSASETSMHEISEVDSANQSKQAVKEDIGPHVEEGRGTDLALEEGGSTELALKDGGSTELALKDGGSTELALEDGGSTELALEDGGSTELAVEEGGSTELALEDGGSTELALEEGGSTELALEECGSTELALKDGGSTELALEDGGSTELAVEEGGSTELALEKGGSTELALEDGGSTELAVEEGGSTELALEDGGSTELALKEGGSTELALKEGGSTELALEDGGSTELAVEEGGSTELALEDGGSTELALKEGGSTELALKEGGSTELALEECGSTELALKEGGSTELALKDGGSTELALKDGGSTELAVKEPVGMETDLSSTEVTAYDPVVTFTQSPSDVLEQPDWVGSIMQSEEEIPGVAITFPSITAFSHVPSSPVLPTTMETVPVPLNEEVSEESVSDDTEEELLSFSPDELSQKDQLQDTTALPTSLTVVLTPQASIEEEQVMEEHEIPTPQPEVAFTQSELLKPTTAGIKEALYTAWLPSPWTQDILSHGPNIVTQSLTCPGLVADVKTVDPVGEILAVSYPHCPRRPQLSVEQVSMDTEGLRRLVQAGCLHAALELTGRFLSAHGQGMGQAGQQTMHTHKTLQMWAARIALLVHMRRLKEAELEMTAFGELDNPDLFYQYHAHSYPGKAGSMIPFSLRLLHAQLPSYTGNPQLALDRLCMLQGNCQQVLSEMKRLRLPWTQEPLSPEDQEIAESLWLERLIRVQFSIGNCLASMEDYTMAIDVYESLVQKLPSLQAELLSAVGRLCLQLGNLQAAQKCFSQISDGDNNCLTKINNGLVSVFLSRWQSARESFEAALAMEPNNLVVRNNIAICSFFEGRLKESISHMESLIKSNPPVSLQPGVFHNLSAAYELESGHSHAKKLSFLPLLAQHVGEGFYLQSLSLR